MKTKNFKKHPREKKPRTPNIVNVESAFSVRTRDGFEPVKPKFWTLPLITSPDRFTLSPEPPGATFKEWSWTGLKRYETSELALEIRAINYYLSKTGSDYYYGASFYYQNVGSRDLQTPNSKWKKTKFLQFLLKTNAGAIFGETLMPLSVAPGRTYTEVRSGPLNLAPVISNPQGVFELTKVIEVVVPLQFISYRS